MKQCLLCHSVYCAGFNCHLYGHYKNSYKDYKSYADEVREEKPVFVPTFVKEEWYRLTPTSGFVVKKEGSLVLVTNEQLHDCEQSVRLSSHEQVGLMQVLALLNGYAVSK